MPFICCRSLCPEILCEDLFYDNNASKSEKISVFFSETSFYVLHALFASAKAFYSIPFITKNLYQNKLYSSPIRKFQILKFMDKMKKNWPVCLVMMKCK